MTQLYQAMKLAKV